MHIVLFRNGSRALILPAAKALFDCPPPVRHWLGDPCTETVIELSRDTPLPDMPLPTLLGEILQKGFCALDLEGVVRAFPPLAVEADGDARAIEVLREDGAPAATRVVKPVSA